MSKRHIFYINGMTCISCSNSIEAMLKKNYELESIQVDLTTPDPKKATIVIKNEAITWQELATTITDMGYDCEAVNYSLPLIPEISLPAEKISSVSSVSYVKKILKNHWFLGALGTISGIVLLVSSLMVGSFSLTTMIPVAVGSILLTLLLGAKSYKDAYKKLLHGTLTMDTLFSISTLSVLLVSTAAFFIPWLPMMFEAALLIYGFRHIGLGVEESLKEKISSAKFQDRAPTKVRKCLQEGTAEVDIFSIEPQDFVLIYPGELIPFDGLCENESIIYNTIKTGSTNPRLYTINEKVLAGMRLAKNAAPLRLRVLHSAKNSNLARLDNQITEALTEKAPLEIQTGKILQYFIPLVIGLAIGSGLIIGTFFTSSLAIQCAISVLITSCPCTLGLIVPLAVKTGMHKAAEHGVAFKNAKILQLAEQIDTVVIDLHGTLTTGIPEITSFTLLENADVAKQDLLNIAATLEQNSVHPVGKAILSFAKKFTAITLPATFNPTKHHSGEQATIANDTYNIGSASLMHNNGIDIKDIESKIALAPGDSLVYIAKNKSLLGYFVITEPLRPDAFLTIERLQKMGKIIHLCTGADQKTAKRYATMLNIKHIQADCVATSIDSEQNSKTNYMRYLKNQGLKVAMIGDGANDAAAIALSDFGVAVASEDGDDITQQTAGAVIKSGSLMACLNAFVISEQTVKNIKQNLLISLIYNVGSIALSSGALLSMGVCLNPALGAALMAVQASIVLLNVYRFKHQQLLLEKQAEVEKPKGSYLKMDLLLPKLQEQSKNCSLNAVLCNQVFQSQKPKPINTDENLDYATLHQGNL